MNNVKRIKIALSNITDSEIIAPVFGPQVEQDKFGIPDGIVITCKNYRDLNAEIAMKNYTVTQLIINEDVCPEVRFSGVNSQGLNWTRLVPLNRNLEEMGQAVWLDSTVVLGIKVPANSVVYLTLEGNYILSEHKPVNYKLSILIFGQVEESEYIDRLKADLQRQLNKLNRQDVDALWMIDKGENTEEAKKRELISNTTGEYYVFTPPNHSIPNGYIKSILKLIDTKAPDPVLLEEKGIFKRNNENNNGQTENIQSNN